MKVCWRWAVISSLWALASLSSAQAQEERVGGRSEIGTFQFSGNATFPADDIRAALIGNADFLIASHPLAPLRPCVELLKKKLVRGYRAMGFPDVTVEVTTGERFQVRIVEGARFETGEIRIEGAKKIQRETLVKRLTEQYPLPEELKANPDNTQGNAYRDRTGKTIEVQPPTWEKSKPAVFGNEEFIENQVERILSELGFLMTEFTVRIEKAAGGKADLVIAFKEEGEPAILSEIIISGNKKNSRSELLDFLKLTDGIPATAKLVSDVEYLLYRSGHFKHAEAKLEPVPPRRAKMVITVEESAFSPRAAAPYSRAETAFLAFRQWLEDMAPLGEVIEVKTRGGVKGELWIGISPQGVVVRVAKLSEKGVQYSLAAMVATNGAGFFSSSSGRKYFVETPKTQVFAGVGLKSSKDEDTTSQIELYGGISSKKREGHPNFRVETQWQPAPFIALAHPTNATLKFEGGAMEYRTSNFVLRVEEATGKLLRWGMLGDDDGGGFFAEIGDKQFIPRFLKDTESYRNYYDPVRPASTFFGYLVEEGFDAAVAFGQLNSPSDEVTKRAATALRKVIRPETFEALDEVLKWFDSEEQFGIPIDLADVTSQNDLAALLAGFVFRGANAIFPENSWPWTVAREAVFAIRGQTQYTGEQLDRLFDSGEVGPVGFYVTAALLNRVQPELAKRFALRGLTRLQGSYFEEDCKLLFEGKTALSRSVAQLARDLQLLDAGDLKAIEALFPGTGELLEKAAARGRADTKASASEMLSPLLEYFLDNHLKAALRKEFQKLAFGEEGGENLVPSKP